jgi:hypothetical protein
MRWHLSNGLSRDVSAEFTFGDADRCRPVTGDWDADGTTTVGVACPSGGALTWSLTNSDRPGGPSYPPFKFGNDATYPSSGGWAGPAWPTANR